MSGRPESAEGLRRATGEAQRRYADLESDLETRQRQAPQPGEVFLLAPTADLPLEWAILERHPDDPRQLLAVPADSNSLVGSADLTAAVTSRSPLSLRCRFAVWLHQDNLDPGMRTGSLEPEALALARAKWRELQKGGTTGSALEREVDADPEYQDWVEDVLDKACSAFPEHPQGSAEVQHTDKPGRVLDFPTRWHSLSNPYAVAATVLLLVSLALGREVTRIASVAELKGSAQPVVNLPFLVLATSGLRGEEKTLAIPTETDLVMLIFQLDSPDLHTRYQLEVRQHPAESGREVWKSSDLRITGHSELSVALPGSLLPAGRYRLLLNGLSEGREQEVARYLLNVEIE